jgi:hypothetical protein
MGSSWDARYTLERFFVATCRGAAVGVRAESAENFPQSGEHEWSARMAERWVVRRDCNSTAIPNAPIEAIAFRNHGYCSRVPLYEIG